MCVYPFGKQLEVENVNKQTFNLKEIKDAGIPDKYCFQDLPFLKLHTVIVCVIKDLGL